VRLRGTDQEGYLRSLKEMKRLQMDKWFSWGF